MLSSQSRRNPYDIGSPIDKPELFFGRERLFQFVEDNLKSGAKVILLHGQRRIGKSSVLSQIPACVGLDEFAFVLLDLQDRSQAHLSDILHYIAVEIVDQLELQLKDVTSPSVEELKTDSSIFHSVFLPKIYRVLSGRHLVFLMDEFDVLNSDKSDVAVENFFPYLQSIIYRQKQLILIPVVGRRLDDMPKLLSLFKEAPSREIGLLDETSAKQLIVEPAEGILKYDSAAIQEILDLSARHPYFTQLICFALFGYARDRQNWRIIRGDVRKIIDRAIEIGEAGLAWFRDGLPIPERVIFSAVAEAQKNANKEFNALDIQSNISQTSNVSVRLKLSEPQDYKGLTYQWLTIEILSEDRRIEPKVLSKLELPEEINTNTGIVITGPAPVWIYSYLMRKLPSVSWIASYDPRLGAIVVSTELQQIHIGQILTLGLPNVESKLALPGELLKEYGVVLTKPLVDAEKRLVEWNFLDSVKDYKASTYKVKIELVRHWLVNRYPLYQEIRELEKLDPKAERIYQRATNLHRKGDITIVIDLYNQVLDLNSNHFSALFDMAAAYLEVEDFGRASALYTRAFQIDPLKTEENYVQALLGYGRDLRLQKEFKLAKEQLRKALDIESDNDEIHSLLAFVTHEIDHE